MGYVVDGLCVCCVVWVRLVVFLLMMLDLMLFGVVCWGIVCLEVICVIWCWIGEWCFVGYYFGE